MVHRLPEADKEPPGVFLPGHSPTRYFSSLFLKFRKASSALAATFALLFTLYSGLSAVPAYAQKPLVVGVDNNFPPYEYVDKDGAPVGYTVDMIRAVAGEMGIPIRLVAGPWNDMRRQFEAGSVDVLSGMFYSKERTAYIDFSIPHSAVTYAVFVRKGERKNGTENSLAGRAVFTQENDIASELLAGKGIYPVQVPDAQVAITKLAQGAGDAAVVAKSVGLYAIREHGIKNLEVADSAFPQQQYCFAVRRNRTDGLIEKLNEGLTILKYNGEQERIAGKWLSPWESSGVALRIVLLVVGSLLVLLAAASAWSWALRRKVREHTLSLQERTASLQRELAERQRAEKRILKLNRLYAVITEVDKLIVRIRDREVLFSEICRLCVEQAGFSLVWVGRVDESPHRLVPVASAGAGRHYLEEIQVSTSAEVPEGRGPAGVAAREGRPAFSKDIDTDPCMAPWRAVAVAHNHRSNAAFPLKSGAGTVAVLVLYSSEPHFFDDEEELALLNDVAGDISFALAVIEGDERRASVEAALQQSEEHFRASFEQAGAGMALCDSETRVQMVNQALCNMLGYSAEEFVGLKLASPQLTHPDDLEIGERHRRQMLNREQVSWENRYLHKDGHPVWTIATAAIVRVAAGCPTHFIVQIQDITERKRAEEELRQANDTLKTVFQTSPVALMVHGLDDEVLAWNQASQRLFGWTAEETVGRRNPMFERIEPEEFLGNRQKVYRGERILNKEVRRERKDGTPVDVSLSAAPLLDREGRVTGTIAVYLDLTERKQAEQDLRQAYETLEGVFRASPVPIVVHDAEGNIAAWNDACERVFGWRADEVVGKQGRMNPLLPPDKMNEFWEHREVLRRGGRILNKEVVRQRKDGSRVDVSLSIAPLGVPGESHFRSVLAYVDLTERKRAEEDLRQAYLTLEGIFSASPTAILVVDADRKITAWNKAAERMFGWTAEEAVGQTFPIMHADPTALAQALEHHHGMLRGVTMSNQEITVQRKDGSLLDVSISGAPMRDAAGRVTSGVAVIADITERKRAQEELRQAFETLEGIFSASLAAIVLVDSAFRVRAWNKAAERMFGWAAQEVIGRELPIVPESGRSQARGHRDALLRGEALPEVEAVARRKDGTLIDISISGAPMRDAEGQYGGGVAVYVDITERKRAERELLEAYERLETTLRASPVALLTVDMEGNATAWNEAAARLFGWTAEEVLGRPLPNIPGDPATVRRSVMERVQQGEVSVNKEVKRQRKDGTLLDVSFSMAPFRDASGQIRGALGAYVDLTGRKKLEAQLLQAQKLESIGQLAGGVAHDFNNLLTVINGYIDLLLNRSDLYGAREWLQEVRKAGEQAASLTRRLLAFSRRQVLQPSVFSLNDVVNDMKEMLQRLLGENIELTTDLQGALWNVKADKGQFQQVIMNLAVNARDAMPDGGRLTIATANSIMQEGDSGDGGPQVVLTVADTGCGMDKETLHRVFEPFFTTKEAGKGTGLGLSTVWGIVSQSGGQVKVQSEPGQGTTFRIFLPRAEGPVLFERTPEAATATRGTETILLVEDQTQLRELTSHILQGYGYKVREVANGQEALSLFEQNGGAIDLVLTDVVMPGITGVELARQLRATHPELKILYMSGYTDDVVLRQGAMGPGSAYLEKPFTPEGLIRKVRQVLGTNGKRRGLTV